MQVRDGMNRSLVSVGPAHTLRQAAAKMARRNAGAAVLVDPDTPAPGIVTERDILVSLARGEDPDKELSGDHMSSEIVYASPSWSLELAAVVMVDRGRRHLLVCDGGGIVGVLSMRDIMRCWTQDNATCALPRLPVEGEPTVVSKPGSLRTAPSNAEPDLAKVDKGQEVLSSVLGF